MKSFHCFAHRLLAITFFLFVSVSSFGQDYLQKFKEEQASKKFYEEERKRKQAEFEAKDKERRELENNQKKPALYGDYFKKRDERSGRSRNGAIKDFQDGKWGFIDIDERIIYYYQFEEVRDFNNANLGENLLDFAAVKKRGKWGFVSKNLHNKRGDIEIPTEYDDVDDFNGHLALVKKNGKWGYINKDRVEVVPFMYDEIVFFGKTKEKEKLSKVKKNGLWGFIDELGKEVIPCNYEEIIISRDGYEVKKDEKWGLLNSNNEEIVPCLYDKGSIVYHSWGCATVKSNDLYGFFFNGKEVIPCKYDEIKMLRTGSLNALEREEGTLIAVRLEDKWGILDGDGKEIVSCRYKGINTFGSGHFRVEQDEKWGILDENGREITPIVYETIGEYQYAGPCVLKSFEEYDKYEHYALVKKDGKTGSIDRNGNEYMPLSDYKTIGELVCGWRRVEKDGKFGFVDEKWNEVISCVYFDVEDIGGRSSGDNGLLTELGYRAVRAGKNYEESKWGFIDKTGKMVIKPQYDLPSSGMFWYDSYYKRITVKKGDKTIYIDKTGKTVK